MDGWHSHDVHRRQPDAVRRWADLEGKSPTMRHDLYARYAPPRPSRRRALSIASLAAEAAAWLHAAWSLLDTR